MSATEKAMGMPKAATIGVQKFYTFGKIMTD